VAAAAAAALMFVLLTFSECARTSRSRHPPWEQGRQRVGSFFSFFASKFFGFGYAKVASCVFPTEDFFPFRRTLKKKKKKNNDTMSNCLVFRSC
jgi:hypothetical protein